MKIDLSAVKFAIHYLLQPLLNRRRVPGSWNDLGPCRGLDTDSSSSAVSFSCERGSISICASDRHIWRVLVDNADPDTVRKRYKTWSVVSEEEHPLFVKEGPDNTYEVFSKGEEDGLRAVLHAEDSTIELFCGTRLLHSDSKGPGFKKGWVSCTKESPVRERYVGFGEKAGSLFKNGNRLVMWNTDDRSFGSKSDPLYQSYPLQIGVREDGTAHGLFYDNPGYSVFEVGGFGPSPRSFYAAQQGPLCYYVLAGPTLKDVIAQFTHLTGRYPLPPRWILGHGHSRWEDRESEHRVLEIADEFRKRRIPCDAIYLDIGHMEGYRCFTWNREGIPNPQALTKALHDKGFKAVVMVDPGLKRDEAWPLYRDGLENGYYCMDEKGKVLHAPVWPGPSAFPDFFSERVRRWWGELYQTYIDAGVDGFWNDMNEPSLFTPRSTMPGWVRHSTDAGPQEHNRIHNLYSLLMVKASYEGIRSLRPEKRVSLLTRSAYAGSQRYASSWTGDNRSSFEHYRLSIPMLLNMGLTGQALVGPDTGGFWGQPTRELMARWMQLATFYPFNRNHTRQGTPPQELWHFGVEVEDIARSYLELRYSLLPYLYTCLYESWTKGLPLMRPLFLEFPQDTKCLEAKTVESQFLAGPRILVAPVLESRQRSRRVYLPGSDVWFDWWADGEESGRKAYTGGLDCEVATPLSKMPVFVRSGSVVPLCKPGLSISETESSPLILKIFPGNRVEGLVYLDDGQSFEYENGSYSLISITGFLESGAGRILIESSEGSLLPVLGQHPSLTLHLPLFDAISTLPAGNESRVKVNGRSAEDTHREGDWLIIDLKETKLPLEVEVDKQD